MNRSRLKKGIEFLIFWTIVLILLNELTWKMRTSQPFSQNAIQGFKGIEHIDVLAFGSSSVHCNYQPMEAWKQKGYTSYNYSTGGLPCDLMVHVAEVTRKTATASVYLFDLRTLPIESEQVFDIAFRYWSDCMPVFSPLRIKEITAYLSKKDLTGVDVVSYYFDIAKYHTNYRALLHRSKWPFFKRLTYRMLERGFNSAVTTNCVPFQRPQPTSKRGELTDYQRKTLDELLDYCDREQLQVLFIVAPYILPEEHWQIYNTSAEIIRERGYDFVNFNELYDELGLNFETDFADKNHLNYLGSEKYTRYLSDFLCQRYDLPDHRGDKSYSKWAEDSIQYAAEQDQWERDIFCTLEHRETTKEIGERLPKIDNFATWFELVQNESFTVLLQGTSPHLLATDDPVASSLVQNMEATWELDPKEQYYVGIWNGEDSLLVAHDTDIHNGEIGLDGGRGQVACTIRAGENPKLTVGKTDYANDLGGIQAVVFDNNYHKVVDCVNIIPDANGVRLVR